jgi:hypothetical protein
MATSLRKRPRFELFPVAHFDTRRGYARCDPAGIDVAIVGERQKAHANIWRAAGGRLVLRLKGGGYTYSYEARLASGRPILDAQMPAFMNWLSDVLATWMVDGFDDGPEPSF